MIYYLDYSESHNIYLQNLAIYFYYNVNFFCRWVYKGNDIERKIIKKKKIGITYGFEFIDKLRLTYLTIHN